MKKHTQFTVNFWSDGQHVTVACKNCRTRLNTTIEDWAPSIVLHQVNAGETWT